MTETRPSEDDPRTDEHPLTVTGHERTDAIARAIHTRFWAKDQILSLTEYLDLVREAPWLHVRSAGQYMKDAFDWFGTVEVQGIGGPIRRFRLFDQEFNGGDARVHGQERIQNQIYSHLDAFSERGRTDKILVLHGPNGTGKSSIVNAIMRGLQHYSHQPEGLLYTFNWIFSDKADKVALGFSEKHTVEPGESLAHLEPDDITFKLRCELRDSPLLLLPKKERLEFLAEAFAAHDRPMRLSRVIERGDLCHKNREIYNELLGSYHGDWARLVQHVQVTRFYVSKRYRRGAVTIEPQRNVDASARPINLEKSFALPGLLHQANLHETSGDLIDGNRGVVEYSDFFKRPMEMNKYLLTTSEQGTISLSSTLAFLDVVLFATSNEKHLSIFKLDPDFSSFKARMELITVPYLLQWRREAEFYGARLPALARGKPVCPHVDEVLGLWAVLTRLRRPDPAHYEGSVAGLVKRLGPIEKAELYDSGRAPPEWRDQDRRELLSALPRIASEFDDAEGKFEGLQGPEYEGRRGVSAREMLTLINEAALDRRHSCLSVRAVLDAIAELVKDRSVHDFLRLDSKLTYGDVEKLTKLVEDQWRRWVTAEFQDSTQLISEGEYERLFNDYFVHVKAWKKGEKVENRQTGEPEPPSDDLMKEVERILELEEEPAEFRSNLIMRIAGWAIDHPGEPIGYREIFSDIFEALKAATYRDRRAAVEQIQRNILKHGTDEWESLMPAERDAVEQTLATLKSRYGYCVSCARETLSELLAGDT